MYNKIAFIIDSKTLSQKLEQCQKIKNKKTTQIKPNPILFPHPAKNTEGNSFVFNKELRFS